MVCLSEGFAGGTALRQDLGLGRQVTTHVDKAYEIAQQNGNCRDAGNELSKSFDHRR